MDYRKPSCQKNKGNGSDNNIPNKNPDIFAPFYPINVNEKPIPRERKPFIFITPGFNNNNTFNQGFNAPVKFRLNIAVQKPIFRKRKPSVPVIFTPGNDNIPTPVFGPKPI